MGLSPACRGGNNVRRAACGTPGLWPVAAVVNCASRNPGRGARGHIDTYSYRRASAGRILDADHEGYRVATNETSNVNTAIQAPSTSRGAKGT